MHLFAPFAKANNPNIPVESYPTFAVLATAHAYSYMQSLSFLVGLPGTLVEGLAWTEAYAATWYCFVSVTVILRFLMFLDVHLLRNVVLSGLETRFSIVGTEFPC